VGLVNLGNKLFSVSRGDRIAQLVLAPVTQACLKVVDDLPASGRQAGGFGHTGV
jgi:dUTP pyrophosphatase